MMSRVSLVCILSLAAVVLRRIQVGTCADICNIVCGCARLWLPLAHSCTHTRTIARTHTDTFAETVWQIQG